MYKMVVNQTNIIINDYELGSCHELEKYFIAYNRVTHMQYYANIDYNEETRQLFLPRGLDIAFVESVLNCKAYFTNKYSDCRSNIAPTLVKYKPKDDKQKEAISFLASQGQYKFTKNYNQYMIGLTTGSGKTYLGIFYMSLLNVKSIIITESVNWLDQWKERICEHSNILQSEIYFIKGSACIKSLLRKGKEELDSKYKIYLCTHGTLQNFAKNNSWDDLDGLFSHLGIGIKIFDEAHLYFDTICMIDYHTSVYKTLYLTATPARGDERLNEIYSLYFKNIPTIRLFDPNEDPRTNYISLHYHSGMSPVEISKCMSKYGFNRTLYCDQVVNKRNFYQLCTIIMDLISRIRGKTLIFLATNNAVLQMYDWIEANYPEYRNGGVGIFTSINEDKNSSKSCPIILTTSKSAGAALDISGLTCSVALAEPFKSQPQNQQRLGRTRGKGTFYIDVVDLDCSTIKKYYMLNLPMFEKYALSTKELKFSNTALSSQASKIYNERINHGISPFIKMIP